MNGQLINISSKFHLRNRYNPDAIYRHKNDRVHGSKEQETLLEGLNLDILNMVEKEIDKGSGHRKSCINC